MREGLLPNGATHLLRFVTNDREAQALTVMLPEFLDPEEVAVTAFEESSKVEEDWGPKSWHVEVYFAQPPHTKEEEERIRQLLSSVLGEAAPQDLVFEAVQPLDWISASLAGLTPVEVGAFFVHGQHDRHRRHPHHLALEIEAALAFGTGHHGTTRGCLSLFWDICKRRSPQHVLDVGTGTGVLALAAARKTHRPVVACDIDPVCVQTALRNARLNHLAPLLHAYVSNGVHHIALQKGAPYDVIFANILASPLRNLAPKLARLLTREGDLILSGLLKSDVKGVLSAYRLQGITLRKYIVYDGWWSLWLRY